MMAAGIAMVGIGLTINKDEPTFHIDLSAGGTIVFYRVSDCVDWIFTSFYPFGIEYTLDDKINFLAGFVVRHKGKTTGLMQPIISIPMWEKFKDCIQI